MHVIFCVLLLVALSRQFYADGAFQLQPSNQKSFEHYGSAVAIDGNVAVVGAHLGVRQNGERTGKAFIFRWNGKQWIEEAQLVASDGSPFDDFGRAVAISGNTVVVGAFNDEPSPGFSGSGSAYVFRNNNGQWSQEAKLELTDPKSEDQFGWAVATNGSQVLIGAYGRNVFEGEVVIFEQVNNLWSERSRLTGLDTVSEDQFGRAISIDGDRIVVGAPYSFNAATNIRTGAAYVFVRSNNGWIQQNKLLPADGADYDNFGWSVSISGDQILIGKHSDDHAGGNSGSAYIFSPLGSKWVQESKITADDARVGDYFGISVNLQRGRAVIGAPHFRSSPEKTGSVYVYQNTNGLWLQLEKLVAPNGMPGDRFGSSVWLDGSNIAVGATHVDAGFIETGSSWIFNLNLLNCPEDLDCSGFVGSSDLGLLLENWGGQGASDINNDGVTSGADLGRLLGRWGACE